jgi:hypothetical protein
MSQRKYRIALLPQEHNLRRADHRPHAASGARLIRRWNRPLASSLQRRWRFDRRHRVRTARRNVVSADTGVRRVVDTDPRAWLVVDADGSAELLTDARTNRFVGERLLVSPVLQCIDRVH